MFEETFCVRVDWVHFLVVCLFMIFPLANLAMVFVANVFGEEYIVFVFAGTCVCIFVCGAVVMGATPHFKMDRERHQATEAISMATSMLLLAVVLQVMLLYYWNAGTRTDFIYNFLPGMTLAFIFIAIVCLCFANCAVHKEPFAAIREEVQKAIKSGKAAEVLANVDDGEALRRALDKSHIPNP